MAGQNKRNLFNFYETENDLLVRGGCSIHLPLGQCASLIHATCKFFFYSLSSRDDDQSYVRLFTYSHCSLTNWENKSPGKIINLLPCNPL